MDRPNSVLGESQAQAAIHALPDASPPKIALPATLTISFRNADLADMATWLVGVERVDPTTVLVSDEDPLRLYRTFVHTVLLTREIAE